MDDLAWLRLQMEWGVDEALQDAPVDRRAAAAPPPPPRKPEPIVRIPSGPAGVAQARAAAEAAPTLAALRTALDALEGCALRATATTLVFAEGNPQAGLALIADVPGAAEDRAGLPFAGAGALLLDRMFASAGLDRASCYAMSMLPWRPPGDRKPTDGEVQLCLPFFHRHLQLATPRRAVLFGGLGARTLLSGSRRSAGVWHDMAVPGRDAPLQILALPSLSHIQTTPSAKRATWNALLQLRRRLAAEEADHN